MVVFPTTTDAMHMQQAATKYKLPGRMIPLPGGLEAGCGLAWCTLPEQKNMLEALTEELGINTHGFFKRNGERNNDEKLEIEKQCNCTCSSNDGFVRLRQKK